MEGHGIDRMRLSFAPVYRQPPSSAAAGRVRCLGRAVIMYWVKRASGRAQAHWVTGFWKIPLGASSVKMRSLLQQMILSLLLTLCIRGTR